MDIRNNSSLPEVASFIENYSERLEKYSNRIDFLNSDHQLFQDVRNEPALHRLQNICVFEDECDELELTEQEIWALIAHEIGHIIHNTGMRGAEGEITRIQAETLADSMATELGLDCDLTSALKKMIDSGNYEDKKDDITSRIAELEKQVDQ